MEEALLPHRRGVRPRLERVLDQDRLGLLGVAEGRQVPELRDAQRVRGFGRARDPQEPEGSAADGGVELFRVSRGRMTIAIVAAMPEELAPLRARLVGATRASHAGLAVERGRL